MSQSNRYDLVKSNFMWSQKLLKIRSIYFGLVAACLCIVLLFTLPSQAHFRNQSYLYLKLNGRTVAVRTEMTVEDVNRALDLSIPLAGADRGDVDPVIDRVSQYVLDNTDIQYDGISRPLSYKNYRFLKVPFGQFILIDYTLDPFEAAPQSLDIRFTPLIDLDGDRKNLLVIEEDWRSGVFNNEGSYSLVFTPEKPEQSLDLSNSTVLNGFISTIKRGLKTGLQMREYAFFLMASALAIAFGRSLESDAPSSRTAGALASHTVTSFAPLAVGILVALGGWGFANVAPPWRWATTASAIAFGLAALELVLPVWRSRLGWLSFLAGLAFGSVVAERAVKLGLFRHYAFLSWLGLGLGFAVAGAALMLLLTGLAVWAKSQDFASWVLRISAVGLGVISTYWIVKRAFEIDVQVFALARSLFQ